MPFKKRSYAKRGRTSYRGGRSSRFSSRRSSARRSGRGANSGVTTLGGKGWLAGKFKLSKSIQSNTIHVFLHNNEDYTSNVTDFPASLKCGAFAFRLDGTNSGYIDYVNMFEDYRINKCRVDFIPCGTQQLMNRFDETKGNHPIVDPGKLYVVLDYNDAGSPTYLNEFLYDPAVMSCKAGQKISFSLYPRCASEVFQSTVSTGYYNNSGKKNPFIRTLDFSVPHFGVKWCVYAPEVSPEGSIWMPRWEIRISMSVTFTRIRVNRGVPHSDTHLEAEFKEHKNKVDKELEQLCNSKKEEQQAKLRMLNKQKAACIAADESKEEKDLDDELLDYEHSVATPLRSTASSLSTRTTSREREVGPTLTRTHSVWPVPLKPPTK